MLGLARHQTSYRGFKSELSEVYLTAKNSICLDEWTIFLLIYK
jgi:hypothetical protein